MDNFTHSLTGWALGQAGLKTKSRKGLAALILGANMPDIDVLFAWVPWVPLATHRGVTHSIVGGSIVMPPMLALLLWLLDRWQLKRGATFKSGLPMHVPWLVALCYIGALSHPLLDLQTTYAVQLLSPFSNRWFHTETMFIIDVWVWSMLAFAIWLSRRRERVAGANWRKPALVGLCAAGAYVALNGAISLSARHALLSQMPAIRPDAMVASEQPVLFWKRELVWRQERRIGRASYDPLKSLTRVFDVKPMVWDNMADPLVRKARDADKGIITFLRWSIMPVAEVSRGPCEITVHFADARFSTRANRGPMSRQVVMKDEAADCRGDSAR
jgi:inner membrane protein